MIFHRNYITVFKCINFKRPVNQHYAQYIGSTNNFIFFVRNDNSRFTIFCFDDIFWNKQGTADNVIEAYTQWQSDKDPSPALRNYIKFKQRVDLQIDKGYNAPSNIAAKFTDKLNAINNRFVPFELPPEETFE